MTDEGDNTCPLCAEEMDLTDHQLKPCKCGYEICVWCWHHIMDMAEKDHTEGRCPACRAPYNKERIVGMTSNCGKLIGGMSVVRKKSQRGKNKTSDGRKQLGDVRVIQRNLVYIVGLPLNLADDDLLQSREYFSQYGKVQKVSISRTAAGSIQQNVNGTFSVYITYSKEEEAVRCIQAVHGFVLEGRPLKACFGTTKYCHAWLRNVSCSNPDCLYLHDVGSQEDSYTKDSILSAYTRVHHIMGTTKGRMGNVLPPPADDYCNNSPASTVKVASKNASSNPASNIRSSPNSSSGTSVGLPAGALWGTRASNNLQPASLNPNGTVKQKPDNSTVTFSATVANQNQFDVVKKQLPNGEIHVNGDTNRGETAKSVKHNFEVDRHMTAATTVAVEHSASSSVNIQLPPEDNGRGVSSPKNGTILAEKSCGLSPGKDSCNTRVKVQDLCSDISSTNIDEHEGLLCKDFENQFSQSITSFRDEKTATSGVSTSILNVISDPSVHSGFLKSQLVSHDIEDDVLAFTNQRLKDPELVTDRVYKQNLAQSFHLSNCSSDNLNRESASSLSLGVNVRPVNNNVDAVLKPSDILPVISTGYTENEVNQHDATGRRVEQFSSDKKKHMELFQSVTGSCTAVEDVGENSIISDVLSLDFDLWEEHIPSRQILTKILGDNYHQQGSLVSSLPRSHSSCQSRFSFAIERKISQIPYADPSLSYVGDTTKNGHFSRDFSKDRSSSFDKYGNPNGFSSLNPEESDNASGIYPHRQCNNISVSRSQVLAPPGFSPSNRAPPPGFTSQERVEQSFDAFSGNHLFDTSLKNQYQASTAGNMVSSGDIEFMDPAILAVGKSRLPVGLNNPIVDTRHNISSQYSDYENEVQLRLLMERSLHPQQNHRYSDVGNNFTRLQDAFSIPPRVMEQTFTENISPFTQLNRSNFLNSVSTSRPWEGWNEVHQTDDQLAMAELLRNERMGFNNYYAVHEESLFRMPSSGDVYNSTFGI